MIKFILKILNKTKYLYYIGRHDILPPPLKGIEEKEALEKLGAGDNDARDLLIEHNSIGTIGLVKAINTFKPDKNIKLATYASRCIENEILMFLRKNNKLRHEISLDEPLNIDYDGNELLLSDIIGTDSDIVKNELEQSDQKAMFYEAFKDLSKREKEILMFRYGLMNYDELTQKDVAKMMGISQSYISRLEKKIIKKLRNKLNYNEIK